MLAVLLALALGAGGALALLAVTEPAVLAVAARDVPGGGTPAVATTEVVATATVISSSPCAQGRPDVVALPLATGPVPVPLEGCGATVGSTVPVRALVTGASGPDALATATGVEGVARLVGAGSTAPLETGEAPSPMVGRVTVTLTVLAGIATAGLLISLGRGRPAPAGAVPAPGASRVPGSSRSAVGSSPGAGADPTVGEGPARRAAAPDRSRPRRSPHAPHPAAARRAAGARGRGDGPGHDGRRPARRGSRR